jgi:hypothetical protein
VWRFFSALPVLLLDIPLRGPDHLCAASCGTIRHPPFRLLLTHTSRYARYRYLLSSISFLNKYRYTGTVGTYINEWTVVEKNSDKIKPLGDIIKTVRRPRSAPGTGNNLLVPESVSAGILWLQWVCCWNPSRFLFCLTVLFYPMYPDPGLPVLISPIRIRDELSFRRSNSYNLKEQEKRYRYQ